MNLFDVRDGHEALLKCGCYVRVLDRIITATLGNTQVFVTLPRERCAQCRAKSALKPSGRSLHWLPGSTPVDAFAHALRDAFGAP